jgi:hypothetical protein
LKGEWTSVSHGLQNQFTVNLNIKGKLQLGDVGPLGKVLLKEMMSIWKRSECLLLKVEPTSINRTKENTQKLPNPRPPQCLKVNLRESWLFNHHKGMPEGCYGKKARRAQSLYQRPENPIKE